MNGKDLRQEGDGAYAEEVRAAMRTRCVHLRTKEQFVGIPSDHERPFEADDAIFWCDRTFEALGPDGEAACSRECAAPGRTCYDAPIRP